MKIWEKKLTWLEDLKCRYPEVAWQTQNGTTSLQTLHHRWGLCNCWIIFNIWSSWQKQRDLRSDRLTYWKLGMMTSWNTVDGSEIQRSPVEGRVVYSILYGWFYKSNRWLHPRDVWLPSTVRVPDVWFSVREGSIFRDLSVLIFCWDFLCYLQIGEG